MENNPTPIQLATLGGGCFWCLDTVYRSLKGVISVASGYSGGSQETANYRDVCSGSTQHAEVVQIAFDPAIITYVQLLEIFWQVHDPTTHNRQGNDVGPQYRSVIFFHDAQQEQEARVSVTTIAADIWENPAVTQIVPFEAFYPAETYHQDYYNKVGGRNPYCTFVISPKVEKFRKKFAAQLK